MRTEAHHIYIDTFSIDIKKIEPHEDANYIVSKLQEAIKEVMSTQAPTPGVSFLEVLRKNVANKALNKSLVSQSSVIKELRPSTLQKPVSNHTVKEHYNATQGDVKKPILIEEQKIQLKESSNTFSSEPPSFFPNVLQVQNQEKSAIQSTDITNAIQEKIESIKYQIAYSSSNEALKEEKKYWEDVLEQIEEGTPYTQFLNKKEHYRFTAFYESYKTASTLKAKQNLNWEVTRLKVVQAIQDNLIGKSKAEAYWQYLLKKLKNPNTDVIRLFDYHESLFLLLKDVLQIEHLPEAFTIISKAKIYPKLYTNTIYAQIGKQNVYAKLRTLQIEKVEGAYQIVNQIEPVAISNIGEVVTQPNEKLPALIEGQWYDRDRKWYPTKEGTSFWKASEHNTIYNKAHLYKTIAQRHAFYKFADAYLKSKGIINEWFDAAARVTINSPLTGQVAVGGADRGTIASIVYLSHETASFLRGGNEFLFKHNMQNFKRLIEGKGTMSLTFTDANGVKQHYTGLTKKALDFKLVEFEQSLVQEYIKKYLKEEKATSAIEAYFEEYIGSTPEEDLETIIQEINKGFVGLFNFAGEDTTETIIEKYFSKNGKLSFDFKTYSDRVKLGKLMVEELYYRRYRDNLSVRLEYIRQQPKQFALQPSQAPFKAPKKDIPEKIIRIKDVLMEVFESYIRLRRIKNNVPNLIKELGYDAINYISRELKAIQEKKWQQIKKRVKNHYRDLENYLEDIVEPEGNSKTKKSNAVEELLEILEKNLNPFSGDYTVVRPITAPNDKIRKLRAKLKEEQNNFDDTFKKGLSIFEELEAIITNPENYYDDKIKQIDHTAKDALISVAKEIYPDLDSVLSGQIDNIEKKKKLLFETNYKATVAILLYEFATGVSKEHQRRFNYNEHPFANKVLEGRVLKEIMSEAIAILERDRYDFETMPNITEFSYQLNLNFSPKLTPRSWLEFLDKHFDSNLSQFFIGGAVAYFYIKDGKLIGMLENKTSRNSLMLHFGENYKLSEASDIQKRPILTTVSQRIYFTFKLPQKK